MNNRTRVVPLYVDFDMSGSDFQEDEAMLLLFGESEPVTLTEAEHAHFYTSGNYVAIGDGWYGEMFRSKQRRLANVTKSDDGRNIVRRTVTPAKSIEGWTRFVYFPDSHLLFVWETGNIRHTRFRNYVRRVLKRDEPGFKLELVAVREEKSIIETLRKFDTIHRLRLRYRHAQSPGKTLINVLTDTLKAEWIDSTYTAAGDDGLDKRTLLDDDDDDTSRESAVISHIDMNHNNGSVEADGVIRGRRATFRSGTSVMEREVPRDLSPQEFAHNAQAMVPDALANRAKAADPD